MVQINITRSAISSFWSDTLSFFMSFWAIIFTRHVLTVSAPTISTKPTCCVHRLIPQVAELISTYSVMMPTNMSPTPVQTRRTKRFCENFMMLCSQW